MSNAALIHRFRKEVCISIGGGDTIYLTPSEAYDLGTALVKYAADVYSVLYLDSELATLTIPLSNRGHTVMKANYNRLLKCYEEMMGGIPAADWCDCGNQEECWVCRHHNTK